MNFSSDNVYGVHPAIMAALAEANGPLTAPAYSYDDLTAEAEAALAEVFETDLAMFCVLTGSAANGLALSALAPGYGAIFAHRHAHIMVDECNGPELLANGAKLIGLTGAGGKITPDAIARTLRGFIRAEHDPKPSAISITNATEFGTIYRPDEIAALARTGRSQGMRLHLDGARFANAVAAAGTSPAELTWKAGVDVMSFGGTKNGALCLEAVVFFDKTLAQDFRYRRMRAGQLLSKGRYLSAQMLAYLKDGLWLDNARIANGHAARLRAMLETVPGVRLPWETQANEIFAVLPQSLHAFLHSNGVHYYEWPTEGLEKEVQVGNEEVLVRLVLSCTTPQSHLDTLMALLHHQTLGAVSG